MVGGSDMPQVAPGTTVGEAIVELTSKGRGCVMVTQDRALCGVFTDGDLRRALQRYGGGLIDMAIDEVMTRTPRTCRAATLAADALQVWRAGCSELNVQVVTGNGACAQGGGVAGGRGGWRRGTGGFTHPCERWFVISVGS